MRSSAGTRRRHRTAPERALSEARAFAVDAGIVTGCLDRARPGDTLFAHAWQGGLGAMPRADRCAVSPVTGHVAESVVELLLDDLGWHILWHHVGPGPHGVDLVLLSPDDKIVATEVKGTLVPARVPRLTRREIEQMSADWLDKADNPGMAELGFRSDDVYGAVVAVNLADLWYRVALTGDFRCFHGVVEREQLTAVAWVDRTGTAAHRRPPGDTDRSRD